MDDRNISHQNKIQYTFFFNKQLNFGLSHELLSIGYNLSLTVA